MPRDRSLLLVLLKKKEKNVRKKKQRKVETSTSISTDRYWPSSATSGEQMFAFLRSLRGKRFRGPDGRRNLRKRLLRRLLKFLRGVILRRL